MPKTHNSFALAAALSMAAISAEADIFHTVDGSITGELCVGEDCVADESLGFDTLRLKANNVRLHFEDTSSTAGFPDNDWRLSANGNAVPLANIFSIDDATSGLFPFVIEAGSGSNSIYVDNGARIGFGTSVPTADLHLVSSGLAELRLESSTLPGDWAVTSGNAGLFFSDMNTNANPFILYNSAPDVSLVVAPTGHVGMGIFQPEAPLHVLENNGGAPLDMMLLENNGGVVFRLRDTSAGGQEFTFQSNGGIFRIASPAVPGPELTMDDFGNVTIKGEITTAGSCNAGCDRVFDAAYELPEMADHHARMWELGHLPNVGPTAEEGPMNLSAKVGGILNELEHAHIYIGQLHGEIADLKAELADQTDRLVRIEAMLAAE